MSKKYKAIVENGAIRIETPDIANGTAVEIDISVPLNIQSKTLFERLEEINFSGLPEDFSTTHKPKETRE